MLFLNLWDKTSGVLTKKQKKTKTIFLLTNEKQTLRFTFSFSPLDKLEHNRIEE